MKKFLAMGLVGCLLAFAALPAQAAEEEVCLKALKKCGVDAVISLLLSGPPTFLAYSSFCMSGYVWCLKYFV